MPTKPTKISDEQDVGNHRNGDVIEGNEGMNDAKAS
jgi:hypothetical protein